MVARKSNGATAERKPAANVATTPIVHSEPDIANKSAAISAPREANGPAGKLTPTQVAEMKKLGIEFSEDVEERHLKIMFWGATGTRKTETVLRNFPNVLLIDTEGNSDMCVRNKAIPPFQRIKTQDSRKVLAVLEAAGKGLIRMPNGDPIQTVCIDSVSVLWGVQQEVAASLAEQRAQRYNKALDEANITQNDWGKAKRPLKYILNRFSKGAIPMLVLIAREKDLVKEMPDGTLQKLGLTPDAVKNTEYDMNLALHFMKGEGGWTYQVTKVQGVLGEIFPDGAMGKQLPLERLFEYAANLKPVADESAGEDDNLADQIAADMMRAQVEHTQASLIKYATEKGFSAAELGVILKNAGFTGFDANRWDEMIAAIDAGTTS